MIFTSFFSNTHLSASSSHLFVHPFRNIIIICFPLIKFINLKTIKLYIKLTMISFCKNRIQKPNIILQIQDTKPPSLSYFSYSHREVAPSFAHGSIFNLFPSLSAYHCSTFCISASHIGPLYTLEIFPLLFSSTFFDTKGFVPIC